jgi:hypothetical protein
MKLGKTDARPPQGLLYGSVLNAEMLPTPPKIFGHEQLLRGGDWGILGNDVVGCCVPCDAAHQTMLWTLEGRRLAAEFEVRNVLGDYAAVSDFDGSPASDVGCDLQDYANYRQMIGVINTQGVRHKIQGWASLKAGNLAQLLQATYIFGAVSGGVQLPSSAEDQFNEQVPWSVVSGDTIRGGHCITIVGMNSAGNILILTWGRLQAATQEWVKTYMDEAVVPLSTDMLNAKGVSPEAYDIATLTKFHGEFR